MASSFAVGVRDGRVLGQPRDAALRELRLLPAPAGDGTRRDQGRPSVLTRSSPTRAKNAISCLRACDASSEIVLVLQHVRASCLTRFARGMLWFPGGTHERGCGDHR